ncbi:MAG: glycine zipper 2TM domain-containing protein [Burkholderiales bacterium]
MKRTIIAAAVGLLGNHVYAASDFVDTAQVISAKPIIERVADNRQECDNVPAPQRSSGIVAPIIGGVVGGLIGHQVGGGSGQTAATIVGATGGAVAGSVIGNRAGAQTEQRCRTVESTREVVNGYDVVYRYNGRDVNVALPYNPGSTIKVGVAAILDDRAADARRGGERDGRSDAYDNRPPPPRRRGPY